jgi:hypothetical protein
MFLRKKEIVDVKDEYAELYQLLQKLKNRWEYSEVCLNQLDDSALMEEWIYKALLYKQSYRYILRLMKEHYDGVRS